MYILFLAFYTKGLNVRLAFNCCNFCLSNSNFFLSSAKSVNKL